MSENISRFFRDLRTAIAGTEHNFTSGSLNRAIFMLAVPMVLEMVMESLFAVVDIYFVSKVSVDAVATIGLTESVIMLVFAIAIGISMAATAMVARRIGEGKPEEAADAAWQSILLGISVSVVLGISGLIYAPDILRLMGGSEQLIAQGQNYTRWMFGGNLTIMLLFLINAVFRGAGDASLAMRTLWLANGINILLDPILIHGFGPIQAMGVEGAAIATTIGRGTGVLYQLYHLFNKGSVVTIKRHNLMFKPNIILRLINVSLGGIGQYLIGTASWIFLVRIIALFGSDVVAGYTISFRIIMFTILPSWGLSNAASTLVGQNLGAGKPDRAERSVWRSAQYNLVFMLIVATIMWLFAEPLVSFFNAEGNVLHTGMLALKYISISYIFFAYEIVISQAFNGAGDTKTPTKINFFTYWIFQLPVAYLLSVTLNLGAEGVFITILGSISLAAIIFVAIFKRGNWKQTEI